MVKPYTVSRTSGEPSRTKHYSKYRQGIKQSPRKIEGALWRHFLMPAGVRPNKSHTLLDPEPSKESHVITGMHNRGGRRRLRLVSRISERHACQANQHLVLPRPLILRAVQQRERDRCEHNSRPGSERPGQQREQEAAKRSEEHTSELQ